MPRKEIQTKNPALRGLSGLHPQVRSTLKVVGFVLLLWGCTAVGAIYLPGTPVPITLQTLALMLAGLSLSMREAGATALSYLVAGAVGLPVFASGASTAALFGPSAGWLWGFVPGIVVTAWLNGNHQRKAGQQEQNQLQSQRQNQGQGKGLVVALRYGRAVVASLVGCIGVVYACGILIQSVILHLPVTVVAAASLGFLPGDLLKSLMAAAVFLSVSGARRVLSR